MNQKIQAVMPISMLRDNCVPEWLPLINQHKKDLTLRKGATAFREGDPVKGVYFILSGKMKIHQQWGEDKELILRFANDGDLLGYRGLGKEKKYPITATALDDTSLMFIEIAFFEATLRINPRLTYALMDFYANELENTEARMRNMIHMEVRGRIAEALLYLESKFGVGESGFIDVKLTKQDIASYVGTTYETVSRITGDFEREKLIRSNGKNISLLKTRQLDGIKKKFR
ncbi:MAG TPA: Crp/Fnr family transcriptional regulator [Niabella sp.]|nr:Crp/Fnr family transcriptional regulator [Niabella sp.]HOZ96814.1 Crp/Fnr family transcriptional regulator [Niabella sp.]HQW14709.1 Crp/Fnr family transcriptional regulator [Niabella sp.]HQX20039.1 Crp/Fnr family transcriptional regulator [Niabella sp.]HQX40659.1 Crp/Fnr family transcriptional regulator [Niabella sp.]